jgi:flagellar biosynthetic protein FliR
MAIDNLLDQALLWLLVFLRIASALVMMPIFGYRGVANSVKVGLAAFVSLILLPSAIPPSIWQGVASGLWVIVGLALMEVVVGIVVGMVTHFVFYGVQLAGQYLGVQIGFAIANVIDPQTEEQISIIGQLQFIFAMLIFITFNGHHFLLMGLQKTFETVPIGGVQFPSQLSSLFVNMMGALFVAAIKIAAPVMAALFLAEVALGIVARTVPQMNIFIVGFPLRIGVGLLALALSWPMFVYILDLLWNNFHRDWLLLIRLVGP